jgi:hypothetical protein
MFSIDQNCHPLWDVVPKLHALTAKGFPVHHFIEDIDVTFTAVGGQLGDTQLRFAPERFHGSGGSDWGAAVFYSEFLSTQPTDLRRWEPYTHMTTAALARRLDMSVDALYDRYSPSGNQQLIGSSYVGDIEHHRLIGDLCTAELASHLRHLLALARRDCNERFPAADSQQRLAAWFDAEEQRLEALLHMHRDGTLVDIYRHWLTAHVGEAVAINTASKLFALDNSPDQLALLDRFVTDYDVMASLYADAMAEGDNGLHPLQTADGELPFFAAFTHTGRFVRAACRVAQGTLLVAGRAFPLDDGHLPVSDLLDAGVISLVGKAPLLVIQARIGPTGQPLALPYHGSSYMPSAFALGRRLIAAGIIDELPPIMRVRLGLLDAMATVETPIRLPDYLVGPFGHAELPASTFAEHYTSVVRHAQSRLAQFATAEGREAWQTETFPEQQAQRSHLDVERRQLAQNDTKSPRLRELSHQVREIDDELFAAFVDQLWEDWQVSQLDFWDTRGAPLPWCIALGGEAFYRRLVDNARIYPDNGSHE